MPPPTPTITAFHLLHHHTTQELQDLRPPILGPSLTQRRLKGTVERLIGPRGAGSQPLRGDTGEAGGSGALPCLAGKVTFSEIPVRLAHCRGGV